MRTKIGDILNVSNGIIIQQVNAQGVMGSGLAKTIREKYPLVFDTYSKEVKSAFLKSGLLGTVIPVQVTEKLLILNIVGQNNYGRDKNIRYTSYDALDTAFKKIAQKTIAGTYELAGDINIPEIGAGLGNGSWPVIEKIILQHLNEEWEKETSREVVFWKF